MAVAMQPGLTAATVEFQSPTLPTEAWKAYPRAACSPSHLAWSRRGPQQAMTWNPSWCRRWHWLVPMPLIPPVT